MEFVVFLGALIAIAVGGFVVAQGLAWTRARRPERDTRFLERTLGDQVDENQRLRTALEEIYATRYAGDDVKAHADCVAIANKALNKARAER